MNSTPPPANNQQLTTLPATPKPQTSKEVIAANVQLLIEQLEAGHSEGLTAYLTAMGRFHNYSFGNILEIARQKPDATRVAGLYAWNQLGRKVTKGQKGIRILAPMIGTRKKKDTEASSKDAAAVNKPVLVGFRAVYVFDVSQTEGAELPAFTERTKGEVGEFRERLIDFIDAQGIALEFKESIAPALGMSYGGRIAILPGQEPAEEFSTLVHELAHEMLHKAERRTATTKTVRETEAEAIAFVVSQTIGLDAGRASADYIHLYHGNAALLTESLEVIQKTSALILSAIETRPKPQPKQDAPKQHRGGGVVQTILDILRRPGVAPRPLPQDRQRTVHAACHRGHGRVRPMGLPALSVAHYGEQNGDAHARPGDVFRAWLRRRRAPEPLLLPQRLRRRRAVEPHIVRHRLRAPCAAPPAARQLRQGVGPQPALAGLRRSLRPAEHSRG